MEELSGRGIMSNRHNSKEAAGNKVHPETGGEPSQAGVAHISTDQGVLRDLPCLSFINL